MKTIYLTDDDEDDRMLIRMAIEKEISDVRIVELESGESLIRAVGDEKATDAPAVVIIDMNMPRMNGLETLERLKADELCREIPVVMLSTTSDSSLVHKAYNHGINAFLEKPIFEQDYVRMAKAIDVFFLNTSRRAEPQQKSTNQYGSIIVIEDNEDQLFFIRNALRQSMPYVEVFAYTQGQKLIDDIKDNWAAIVPRPQLVLMDLYMPTRQAGLDLLLEIHQEIISKPISSIPIVVFTNSSNPDDRKASYANNANAYITKDTNPMHWQNDFRNLYRFWWNTVSY